MKAKYFLSMENKIIPGQYRMCTKSKYGSIDKKKNGQKVTKLKKTIMIKNTVPYIVRTCETAKKYNIATIFTASNFNLLLLAIMRHQY